MQSTKEGKLGLVITDGVGYRNFVLSTFLDEACHKFEHIYIFSGLPKTAYPNLDESLFTIIELPVFKENKLNWFWRKLKEVAHLQQHKANSGIADNLKMNSKKGFSANAILTKIIYAISSVFHSEKNILFYEKLQEISFSGNSVVKVYGDLLKQNKPDVLFFTHQRPPFIATLVYWAKQYKIPTAAFIFSWDNLASKGRMASAFDHYLVWSKLMQDELLRFYTQTTKQQISIVGTPQFEPYVNSEYDKSEDWFYNEFRLKRNLKTICYSCADKSIGPNDPLVIETIAKAIRENMLNDCQLLVRTSPAEDESRFAFLKESYPEIKWNHPKWLQTRLDHPEPWSQRIPRKEDLAELKAILAYCDINVNMCSTMSLDFMLFKKPVVNTVFGNENNGLYNDQRFLNYEHYKNVIDSGAVKIATNENELITFLNLYLQNPTTDELNRKQLIAQEIGQPLNKTTALCVEALKQISDY
ncbi:hypothetical protein ACH3O9_02520 [Leeuwenhoekiella sp. A16]|uniref:hypothetical protein n=1 Tax=Leeuwenhoekiella sp. A16 TaxID=3141462 RepID=UPI003A800FDF